MNIIEIFLFQIDLKQYLEKNTIISKIKKVIKHFQNIRLYATFLFSVTLPAEVYLAGKKCLQTRELQCHRKYKLYIYCAEKVVHGFDLISSYLTLSGENKLEFKN